MRVALVLLHIDKNVHFVDIFFKPLHMYNEIIEMNLDDFFIYFLLPLFGQKLKQILYRLKMPIYIYIGPWAGRARLGVVELSIVESVWYQRLARLAQMLWYT